MSKSKPEDLEFEHLVGGDGDEFTIVCHPVPAGSPSPDDIRKKAAPDLVCRLVEKTDQTKP